VDEQHAPDIEERDVGKIVYRDHGHTSINTIAEVVGYGALPDQSSPSMSKPLQKISGNLGNLHYNGFGLRMLRFREVERENALFKDSLDLRVIR
jgi:hypothetical protein